jgi:hypothetical protein
MELNVQERVLEADRIVIAPSSETVGAGEDEGLHSSESTLGHIFAFDIEASVDALEKELDPTPMAMGTEKSTIFRVRISALPRRCW